MTNTRLEIATSKAKQLFIPFIMAGDPSAELTIEIALTLQKAGADILELGVPYSDPLADGPVIQQAALRALEGKMNLEKAIQLVPLMRDRGLTIPVIIFTYYNPVLQLGEDKVLSMLNQNQIDGILIPDLPFEESRSLSDKCEQVGLPLISLVAPTSKERVQMIANEASGFLYCVSSLGVTGVRKEMDDGIYQFLGEVRKHSKVPVAVGFGISNREQVTLLSPHCDGIIVGSALIKLIETKKSELLDSNQREKALSEIKTFVYSIIS
ncbi:tryptophan synthase subunit alpha [Anaerobacillus alkaliphilus]|uniref:Tryptophan synthase alpha chain n=1 Tax=Anaerobacillus alkaliphilus TaxID=1548597 RepID=A0A4Q0VXQ5_9BACI|nr:tryptophan synthase subunit alpha [Anaerobacillus alkaliphilus]RXJ03956.1 tryptophan synthase subunit alpha [Anaerobacillus alkaliphilus]